MLGILEAWARGDLGPLPNDWSVTEAIEHFDAFQFEPVLVLLAERLAISEKAGGSACLEQVACLCLAIAHSGVWSPTARLGAAWGVLRATLFAHGLSFRSDRLSVPILCPHPLFFDLHPDVEDLARLLGECCEEDRSRAICSERAVLLPELQDEEAESADERLRKALLRRPRRDPPLS